MNISESHACPLSSLPVKHWTMSTWENLHSYLWGISPHRAWINYNCSWVGLAMVHAPHNFSALLIYRDLSCPRKFSVCTCCHHLNKIKKKFYLHEAKLLIIKEVVLLQKKHKQSIKYSYIHHESHIHFLPWQFSLRLWDIVSKTPF